MKRANLFIFISMHHNTALNQLSVDVDTCGRKNKNSSINTIKGVISAKIITARAITQN